MATIQEQLECKIDFVGQQFVDQVAKVILILSTIVSFLIGFALQSLSVTFGIFGSSVVVLALLVLPPWPMLNRNAIKWQASVETKKTK